MHKRIWPVAGVVVLLSLGGAMAVRAAGPTVSMMDGSGDPTTTWKFDPAAVTVAAGSAVTWHNSGQQPHTVSADDGSFKSDYISPGGTFQHTFATAGDFAYHCDPHPWMKAVVHVTGASTPTGATATTTTANAASASTSTTATTARPGAASTSTTTAASGATPTTTASAVGGTTTTTAASTGGAASAAPPTDNSTTTTTAAASEQEAASSHGGSGHKTDTGLVVLAGIVTVLLALLTLKLLATKS